MTHFSSPSLLLADIIIVYITEGVFSARVVSAYSDVVILGKCKKKKKEEDFIYKRLSGVLWYVLY